MYQLLKLESTPLSATTAACAPWRARGCSGRDVQRSVRAILRARPRPCCLPGLDALGQSDFLPLQSAIGGLFIGAACGVYMLSCGRIAGNSGVIKSLILGPKHTKLLRDVSSPGCIELYIPAMRLELIDDHTGV